MTCGCSGNRLLTPVETHELMAFSWEVEFPFINPLTTACIKLVYFSVIYLTTLSGRKVPAWRTENKVVQDFRCMTSTRSRQTQKRTTQGQYHLETGIILEHMRFNTQKWAD